MQYSFIFILFDYFFFISFYSCCAATVTSFILFDIFYMRTHRKRKRKRERERRVARCGA